MFGGIEGPLDKGSLREFPGISPAAFQHAGDLEAGQALSTVPLLPRLLKKMYRLTGERFLHLSMLANAIRLGPNQGRNIYEMMLKAARILDISELPELYLSSQLQFNAFAFGVNRYHIVLFAPLVEALSEEELFAVIAHELGHIKCNHQQNRSVVSILQAFGETLLEGLMPGPAAAALRLSLQSAVFKWYRMAELSCDRAALLAVQNPMYVATMLSKLAGASRKTLPVNLDAILEQAREYERANEGLGQFLQ